MRATNIAAGVAMIATLAGCHNSGWRASSAAFGTRDALKPLIHSAPTPEGGALEFELREPAYVYVYNIIGDRAVMMDGISYSLLKPGSHRMALGAGGGSVTPVIAVVANPADPRPLGLPSVEARPPVPATRPAFTPGTLPPETATSKAFYCQSTVPETLGGTPCKVSPVLAGRQASADRRLVVIARTDPPRASDFVLTYTNRVRAKEGWKDVDLSGLTSDAAIIDALRKNLDEPGKESRDWMAVAVLVAPEPARGKAAAP